MSLGDAMLPETVDGYLRGWLVDRHAPLVLRYDDRGELRQIHGEQLRYGLAGPARDDTLALLDDMFVGQSSTDTVSLPYIELPNGRCVHVHRTPESQGCHVLLLDAEDERHRRRELQQAGHVEALVSHEKSRAIGRLHELRSELEQQQSLLEEANGLKNALIATMSHEFRTPLTSIFGYLHLLERRGQPESAEALRALRRNASYLLTLAENLLEYGRGESGAALREAVPVDVQALAEDMDVMFRPLAEDKGLSLRIVASGPAGTSPAFDEVRLRQIVVNLVSNAIRYTERGEVSARLDWDGRGLRIEVVDTGPGIPDEFHERVFRPFNRGGPQGSKGAGLGLSIVRRLVEQMQGTLNLESSPAGSCFRVELPLQAHGSSPEDSGRSEALPQLCGLRAIVVDDDPDVAGLLEVLLMDLGISATCIAEGVRAFAQTLSDPPDLLLVDVQLGGGVSGHALVFRLRAQGYRGRIVMLSAAGTREMRDVALRSGADFFLPKPIQIEQFVRTIEQAARLAPGDVRIQG